MILLEGICANFTLRLAKILADNIRKSGNNMRVVSRSCANTRVQYDVDLVI